MEPFHSTRYFGSPGYPIRPRVIRDSDVSERFADREMVESIDDLEGEVETLPTKAADVQKPDDIWEVRTAGSPGYGDPLLRDPADVAADVARGIVSRLPRTIYTGLSSKWTILTSQSVKARLWTDARKYAINALQIV